MKSLTVKEAAEALGISTSQVRRICEELGAFRIGKRGIRIPERNIEVYQRRQDRRVANVRY